MSDESIPAAAEEFSPAASVPPAKKDAATPAAKPAALPKKPGFTGRARVWFKDPKTGVRKLGGGED